MAHLTKEIEQHKKRLTDVREELDDERSVLEEAEETIATLRKEEKSLVVKIRDLERELEEEGERIRCPTCNKEFKDDELSKLLTTDESGNAVFRCPNKACRFSGYRNEKPHEYMFADLMETLDRKKKEFVDKTFCKIDRFALSSSATFKKSDRNKQ